MPDESPDAEALLRTTPVFRNLSPEDRRTVARVSTVRHYPKGETIFEQGVPSDAFYTIAVGRVKIFKMLPNGKDLILEVFGTGDPLGAVAAYNGRPFPASAVALEDTTCVVIPRGDFFRLSVEDLEGLERFGRKSAENLKASIERSRSPGT